MEVSVLGFDCIILFIVYFSFVVNYTWSLEVLPDSKLTFKPYFKQEIRRATQIAI